MEVPEAVRPRLVSLVAACLDEVGSLPPALRRVAAFAPARRARLGAAAIVEELQHDDDLRSRVSLHVRSRANGEPADVAAVAWLAREEGWQETVADAVRRLEERVPSRVRDDGRERRLVERAEAAERALREQRQAHRAAVDPLKAEVATLRRALGEARARERAAREEADAVRARAETATARLVRDLRQARGEVTRLEEEAAQQRRAGRVDRDAGSARTRMLLDTLGEAVVGLRRELAVPTSTTTPGERAEVQYADDAVLGASAGPPLDDSGRLDQVLALPRPRLIIDGYNVTKSAWPTLTLEAQRTRLLGLVGALVARTGAETTVVFDGAGSQTRSAVAAPRGVRAVFSPAGVIADDVIRDLVAAEPPGRVLVVVTDDRALAADVRRAGGRPAAARALVPAAL